MSYTPGIPPLEYSAEWIRREMDTIHDAIDNINRLILTEYNQSIDKPRNGLFIFADGTNFNPGEGRGLYLYDGDDSYWYKIQMRKVISVSPTTGSITFSKETPTVS